MVILRSILLRLGKEWCGVLAGLAPSHSPSLTYGSGQPAPHSTVDDLQTGANSGAD